MIGAMHEKTNGPVFKIIFALVSLSFVIGGIGGGFIAGDNSAAKVNGETISQPAFNQAQSREQNVMNQQLGERFWDLLDNPEYAKQFRESVLNSLINDELLRQYGKELKLGISAEQIKSEIVNSAMFQQDGKFSNALYQQLLRNNAISADQYAYIVSEGMLFSQIQQGIVDSSFTVPAQQELLAKLLLQKREVRLATFPIAKEIPNQAASEQEIAAYYEAHKANFVNPEQLTVEYVAISPSDVAKNVQVTDEQIQTYYDTNRASYVTKGEARVAHIQFSDEAEAQNALTALQNGSDFAQLAKEKSTDKLSANQGGDLGWAKAGTFPKAFEEAANALEAGQYSKVVKVDNAFHIIKVLERRAETVIPLENVKAQIAETIRSELLATEYSRVTREMANRAFENNGSLAPVADVTGATIVKTDAFTQANVPAELSHSAVMKVLFNGDLRQNGQNSDPLEVGDGNTSRTMFVRVSAYTPESVKTLEQAKAEAELAVKTEKAEKALVAKAEEAVKANQFEGIQFADKQELVYAQALASEPVLTRSVFAMAKPTEKTLYQTARNAQNDVVIVALDKVVDGSLDEFKPLAQQMEHADRQVLRSDLLQDLRNRASVEINQEFLEQSRSH